ncbi:putative membrane protein [Novosphingobium sp. Rr 2-17]|uniref:oligosaccharide flippase family protein n=1 Tax=Novosphingobium sp. Rr 2-17 TaxID=555793 RepID=UPI0002697ED1|nr:oligosaccharide flippase family protein [Novosphingobium sp. Rr 2-17]EIZ79012.1 putative membrane protein [Novosphingobium sp. Rr 2-17]
MAAKPASIASKSLWTIGTYVASAGIRFSSNIVLSRLLGPEILGIVVIAQAIRTGCDLLTDLGPEQNIVHSPHGDDERFLNTVWTMQVLRGLLVSIACLALSPLLARFYHIDTAILMAVSAAPLLNSFMSTSIFSVAKRLEVRTRNVFELGAEAIGLIINITLALTLRNVWAPILGILFAVGARTCLTYLLPHPRHRFVLDKVHGPQIFHFSKWIMLSSLAFYAAIYVDRLFLGLVVPLATLGVYGLAKAVSDLPNTVAGRLAFQIVFPFVASHQGDLEAGSAPRAELSRVRLHFLLLVLLGIATVMAWSDWAVRLLYGHRYVEAGWMLCLLLIGGWIAVLSSLNEAAVFGHGKAQNVSYANVVRFAVMGTALAGGFALWGLPGALLALPASELARYVILTKTQLRMKLTFLRQDAALSLGLLAIFGGWVLLRLALGLGVPWALIH